MWQSLLSSAAELGVPGLLPALPRKELDVRAFMLLTQQRLMCGHSCDLYVYVAVVLRLLAEGSSHMHAGSRALGSACQ